MKLQKSHYLGIILAIIIATAAFIFFNNDNLQIFLLSIAGIITLLPFILTLMMKQGKQQEKEEKFLAFSRDLVENVKSGTPINKSINNLKTRNYGQLSPHIKKLANQLEIGIGLEQALQTFAKETKSTTITRAVSLISEAQKAGGNIETILESVATSINQTENLKKERKASVSNLVTQGYIIFIVFIVIMLILEFRILPLVNDLSTTQGLEINIQNTNNTNFSLPLLIMLLVQSLFAGLVIGKISEGNTKKGIKHSFILLTLTILIITGTRALFG